MDSPISNIRNSETAVDSLVLHPNFWSTASLWLMTNELEGSCYFSTWQQIHTYTSIVDLWSGQWVKLQSRCITCLTKNWIHIVSTALHALCTASPHRFILLHCNGQSRRSKANTISGRVANKWWARGNKSQCLPVLPSVSLPPPSACWRTGLRSLRPGHVHRQQHFHFCSKVWNHSLDLRPGETTKRTFRHVPSEKSYFGLVIMWLKSILLK